ncbi:short-chain dehydrogenase reductase SDR [Pyrrhoderma noxium]|uniref:Short-chain dehydrogenase reductase SDR n=1 Tax=Pyrrhoderma noxium TaxID=2282107 RepID=A0A286UQ58_9AGAM|nr:short-chain dehydrogenase reductase SDR [Pyrrhoderma noxium]
MSATEIHTSQLAVLHDEKTKKLELVKVPVEHEPGEGEVLIQNVAVASNPKDWKYPEWSNNFSYIEGSDVAGYVVKVGKGVTDFKVGERVAAMTKLGTSKNKFGAYAQYSIAPAVSTIKLPDHINFDEGSTLPLAVFTAALGLFVNLGVDISNEPTNTVERTTLIPAIIVFGAASSVGSYVVQIANHFHYYVVGVAGHSAEYVKSIGADTVIDYRDKSSDTVVREIVKSLEGHKCTLAFDTIVDDNSTVILAQALNDVSPKGQGRVTHLLPLSDSTKSKTPDGIETVLTIVSSVFDENFDFCSKFSRKLPSCLTHSKTNPNPLRPNRPRILPKGLASVAEGLEMLKNNKPPFSARVLNVTRFPGFQNPISFQKANPTMSERLNQIAGHLTTSHPKGLLNGEVVIVTGAAQGIGRSCAILFAKEGAKVVVSDLDESKAQKVVEEINAAGGDAIAVGGDVGADDFPQRILKATIDKYGKVNHIVNNAGFTYDKMLHTMPDDAFDVIMKIHVRAPFRLIRAAAPYFRIKGGNAENRSIVNVSSVAGLHGNVGQTNYSAAKSAVVGMTKTIAKEWGVFGVRANTVAFGFVQTRLTAAKEKGENIIIDGKPVALGIPGAGQRDNGKPVPGIPLGRGATPDEAANSILFLISPLASYVSGHCLEVTGGSGI